MHTFEEKNCEKRQNREGVTGRLTLFLLSEDDLAGFGVHFLHDGCGVEIVTEVTDDAAAVTVNVSLDHVQQGTDKQGSVCGIGNVGVYFLAGSYLPAKPVCRNVRMDFRNIKRRQQNGESQYDRRDDDQRRLQLVGCLSHMLSPSCNVYLVLFFIPIVVTVFAREVICVLLRIGYVYFA